jgi:hypothetical protein
MTRSQVSACASRQVLMDRTGPASKFHKRYRGLLARLDYRTDNVRQGTVQNPVRLDRWASQSTMVR